LSLPCGRLAAQANGLAKTPPMGWSSWNLFACNVKDADVRAQADAMASNGMRDAGYEYVNIDDCWEGKRDAQGNIQSNERFSDMKALADYVHSKGLKIGIYSGPGPKTCGGFEASYQHEDQDARTYAAWGFDYLKYDMCSARNMFRDEEWPGVYKKMGDALLKTGRPIVYSISHGDNQRIWSWAPSSGANLWRIGTDIRPDHEIIEHFAFLDAGLERYAGPGHWNDPDMLEVGNGKLNADEDRQHFGLWCLLAAPLIAGNDLAHMSPEIQAILTNREAIAMDQDPAGIQGKSVWQEGPVSVWVKPMADGSKAVGLVNMGESPNEIEFSFRDAGLPEWAELRDVFTHKDLGVFQKTFKATVPTRGILLLRVRPVTTGTAKPQD
jgi:alpha-galactosidase